MERVPMNAQYCLGLWQPNHCSINGLRRSPSPPAKMRDQARLDDVRKLFMRFSLAAIVRKAAQGCTSTPSWSILSLTFLEMFPVDAVLCTSIKLITVATPETEATAFSAASFWIECSTTPSNFTTEFFTLTLSVSLPFSVGTPWSTFQTASDNLWSRVNAGSTMILLVKP